MAQGRESRRLATNGLTPASFGLGSLTVGMAMAIAVKGAIEPIFPDSDDEEPIHLILCLRIDDDIVVQTLDDFKRTNGLLLDAYRLKFSRPETKYHHIRLAEIFLRSSVEYERCRMELLNMPLIELDYWELLARHICIIGVSLMGRGTLCANITTGGRFLADLQLLIERHLDKARIAGHRSLIKQRPHIKLLSYDPDNAELHKDIGLRIQGENRVKSFGQHRVDAIQVLRVIDSPEGCQSKYFDDFTIPIF